MAVVEPTDLPDEEEVKEEKKVPENILAYE